MATAEKAVHKASAHEPDLVDYGREVIATERAALEMLGASLSDEFGRAVASILALRGRLVTTGIGKSGYVARKFAATLASTGTPALFVHPAEAAHGDLGMLLPGDGLIVLSNSGNTAELQPILNHATKLGLAIIGITGKRDSLVMRHAAIRLVLPPHDEACPANLAPTSSSVMMLSLSDALAMAAARARGLSRAGFEALHPGGTIGKRLMRVAAIMHRDAIPLVVHDAPMRDVIVTMTAASFGIAGVVDEEGGLVGVITDGDLRRNIDRLMDVAARDVMTRDPVTVAPGQFVEDALGIMNQHKITAMFTIEDGMRRPVGLVHVHDFLRLGLA